MNSTVYSRTLIHLHTYFPSHPLFLPTPSQSTRYHNHILTYPPSHLFTSTDKVCLAHPLTRIFMPCPNDPIVFYFTTV